MTSAPSLAQVRAQVQSIREKFQKARAIAISLPALDAALPVPATLRIGSEELPVFSSDSVLALRDRLVDLPDYGPPLVVLTDLPEPELGNDLLARFAHRRVYAIEPWQLVKDRFRAKNVDPRLTTHHAWVARALLDAEPEERYPPVPKRFPGRRYGLATLVRDDRRNPTRQARPGDAPHVGAQCRTCGEDERSDGRGARGTGRRGGGQRGTRGAGDFRLRGAAWAPSRFSWPRGAHPLRIWLGGR